MISVEFLGPIGIKPMQVECENLEQLSVILKNHSVASQWLENCAVAVNDRLVKDKNMILNSGDKISLLPPVCGG